MNEIPKQYGEVFRGNAFVFGRRQGEPFLILPHGHDYADAAVELAARVEKIEAAIRKHRDQRGDDRCHLDDADLYAVLPEGPPDPALLALPPRDVFLANCARFHACRQPHGVDPAQGPAGRWVTAEEVAALDAMQAKRETTGAMGPLDLLTDKSAEPIDLDALVKLAREARARAEAATPGPLMIEKQAQGRSSVHYWIRTVDPLPRSDGAGPLCPRSIAWMTGSLGEHHPSRDPKDYRDDPEIEADATFFAASRTDVPTLADGVIALATENEHLHRLFLRKAEPTFGPFAQKDGLVELPVQDAAGIMRRVIDSLVTTLGDAKNYVAISGFHPEAGKVECIVQRAGKLSPHEARVQAEQHLARAVKLLGEHGIPWEGPTTFLPSPPWDRGAEIEATRPWLRIDVRTDPNAMVCERCGARQEMPRRGTAQVINGMLVAWGEEHKDCQEGDAARLGRGAAEGSEEP